MNSQRCTLCAGSLQPWRSSPCFVRCVCCGLVIRTKLPETGELGDLYQSSWERPVECSAETGNTGPDLARQYLQAMHPLLDIRAGRETSVLDFGAGKGAMSAALRDAGTTVWSVDPFACAYLQQRGYSAVRTVEDLPPGLRFDLIVAMQVVEHLTEPWESFSQLRRLLKPGGRMLITTPNPTGLNARLSGPRWREACKPGHLMFFTPASMQLLLARAGFARSRRLNWHVRYGSGWLSRVKDFCLWRTRLGGDLGYLAE